MQPCWDLRRSVCQRTVCDANAHNTCDQGNAAVGTDNISASGDIDIQPSHQENTWSVLHVGFYLLHRCMMHV